RHSQLRDVVHAGGNFKLEWFLADDATFTVTLRAPILDDLSRTAALNTCSGDTEEALLETDLAISIASLASRGARAFFGTAAAALLAGFMAWNFDFRGCTECGLFEREIHVVAQIRPTLYSATAATSSASE